LFKSIDIQAMKIPPFDIRETERLEALKSYHVLDTLSEKDYDRLTQLASLICETPISLVTLLDEKRQWFKSNTGLSIQETPREYAFCQHAIQTPDTFLEVTDATKDERFVNNPLVTGDPNIRFYAGYPLVDDNGFALGTLCVIDRKPRQLTDNQHKALQLLSEEVMSLIQEKRLKEKLENFEKLFKFSNDLICIAGTDGVFKKINPSFHTLLGWDDEVILSNSFFFFVHPDDVADTQNEIAKLASGEPTINFTHRFRTKSGEYNR
jgi:PAS domain S-box-containing protein